VVSATDPHGRNLGFLDPGCSHNIFLASYSVFRSDRHHINSSIARVNGVLIAVLKALHCDKRRRDFETIEVCEGKVVPVLN
jgi:hypothetical protein